MPRYAAFGREGDGRAVSWLVIGLEWGGTLFAVLDRMGRDH